MMAGAFPHRVSFILTRQATSYPGTTTINTTINTITITTIIPL